MPDFLFRRAVFEGELKVFWTKAKPMPTEAQALPGRTQPLFVPPRHFVLPSALLPPYPDNSVRVLFGMGCFWGAERMFWQMPGLVTTAVGYAGGWTPNPFYEEVCSGLTGHAEVVQVVFDPARIDFDHLLQAFWEGHDPTQGMRQGNDVGTQYRSAVYVDDPALLERAQASAQDYGSVLSRAGYGPITTEFATGRVFYFAEEEHQQYLAKNPNGYCGLGGTGLQCPGLGRDQK
jgi:peptide-methionine (S)-S-oxide reductase